jgi:hypothetical protein
VTEQVAAGVAKALQQVSEHLVTGGMLFGPDRVAGTTRWGYGDERVVGLAVVVAIAAALAVDSVTLLRRDRRYSAAALVRQMIECEYLTWLFAYKRRRSPTLAECGSARTTRGVRTPPNPRAV